MMSELYGNTKILVSRDDDVHFPIWFHSMCSMFDPLEFAQANIRVTIAHNITFLSISSALKLTYSHIEYEDHVHPQWPSCDVCISFFCPYPPRRPTCLSQPSENILQILMCTQSTRCHSVIPSVLFFILPWPHLCSLPAFPVSHHRYHRRQSVEVDAGMFFFSFFLSLFAVLDHAQSHFSLTKCPFFFIPDAYAPYFVIKVNVINHILLLKPTKSDEEPKRRRRRRRRKKNLYPNSHKNFILVQIYFGFNSISTFYAYIYRSIYVYKRNLPEMHL